jgi:hypothetical protein
MEERLKHEEAAWAAGKGGNETKLAQPLQSAQDAELEVAEREMAALTKRYGS